MWLRLYPNVPRVAVSCDWNPLRNQSLAFSRKTNDVMETTDDAVVGSRAASIVPEEFGLTLDAGKDLRRQIQVHIFERPVAILEGVVRQPSFNRVRART